MGSKTTKSQYFISTYEVIRKGTVDDIFNDIAHIESVSFSASDAFPPELLAQYAARIPYFFVISCHEDIVGYIMARQDVTNFDPMIEIISLAILPEYRKKGYAYHLMTYLEKRIREDEKQACSNIHLTVRASNEAAKQLYLKCGYTFDHIRNRYYLDGEDGHVMMKLATKSKEMQK